MNRLALLGVALLAGCAPVGEPVRLDMGEAEDYLEYLEAKREVEAPEPFAPEPLQVSATGKVTAEPDIAVITATISAIDKNESRAVADMGATINAVQTALAGQDIETGFTDILSRREFDERCLNENRFAIRRHQQIVRDYYFNQRLDNRGDTKTKRRVPKPRVKQRVCEAQEIEVKTRMVIRIRPAEAAGGALRALSEAGAENSRLFGYDFSDYDALYQEAAAKAVTQARDKAVMIARVSGGTLGEIESFSVDAPARTGRFGPQPNIIRPQEPYLGPTGSVVDRRMQAERRRVMQKQQSRLNQFSDGFADQEVVVATGTRLPEPAPPEVVVQEAGTILENGVERPAPSSGSNTNALSMSLLSGPQTVAVTARLGYAYDTPLNGKIITVAEE